MKATIKKSSHPKTIEVPFSDFGVISLSLIPNGVNGEYRQWRTMMEEHHYLRSADLFGQQLKYMIHSSRYGIVGGLSFSSAALTLAARDRLIGWSNDERVASLSKVVCNSRFLILPWVRVKNLASHILSLSLQQLTIDWEECYGTRPALVETFVDKSIYSGTCYKAANWIHIGETKGRGRNDIKHENKITNKDIYVYKLDKNFCRGSLPVPKKLDWIEKEFQYVALPNLARKKRLLSLSKAFYGKPNENIPAACSGSKAMIKGAYRFFADDKVNMDDILSSHYKNTVERAVEHPVVLAVQDSSSLKYATHKATKGLGCVSTQSKRIGLIFHDTLAFTPQGVPLGLLDFQIWSREPKNFGNAKYRDKKPIEEKESYKWLKSFRAVEKLSKQALGTRWVSVGDREADMYELFDLTKDSNVELLVRSYRDRKTDENEFVWDTLKKEKSLGTVKVQISESKKRKAREAKLDIRSKKINIKKPYFDRAQHKESKNEKMSIWAILVTDLNPPEGEEAITWKLFTTMGVKTLEQAFEKVKWYAVRWGIEVYHRTLKSGCKVEERQFASVEKIKRCLAIDLVVAWRIQYLTMMKRETPDVGCEGFLEEAEWKALLLYSARSSTVKKNFNFR